MHLKRMCNLLLGKVFCVCRVSAGSSSFIVLSPLFPSSVWLFCLIIVSRVLKSPTVSVELFLILILSYVCFVHFDGWLLGT